MAATQLPGLKLWGEWALGESGWKNGMDSNLRLLSAAVQPALAVSSGPLPEGGVSDYDLAWDEETNTLKYAKWSYPPPPNPPVLSWSTSPVQPQVGWMFYAKDIQTHVWFSGTGMRVATIPDAPTDGRSYVRKNGQWVAQDYHVSAFIPSAPDLDSVLSAFILPENMTLPAGASGSVAKAKVAGVSNTRFYICKNDVRIGQINFAAGQVNGTVSVSSAVSFTKHDEISIMSDDTEASFVEGISVLIRFEM